MDEYIGVKHFTFSELKRTKGEYDSMFSILPQGNKIVVKGVISGEVTLSEDDTLGYEDGHVWISAKDPIGRFIQEEC